MQYVIVETLTRCRMVWNLLSLWIKYLPSNSKVILVRLLMKVTLWGLL